MRTLTPAPVQSVVCPAVSNPCVWPEVSHSHGFTLELLERFRLDFLEVLHNGADRLLIEDMHNYDADLSNTCSNPETLLSACFPLGDVYDIVTLESSTLV